MERALANHQIVTLAVYLLGGEGAYVDTEDVAVKANEIAPERFAWRKYADQINIDAIRKRLSDAKKPEKGGYLLGSFKNGWLLTENGLKFAKEKVKDLDEMNLSRKPLGQQERQWRRNERIRLLASDAFQKLKLGKSDMITRQEAETFFRVDDYVVGKARERKMVRILNTFGDDPVLADAVKTLADKVRGGGQDNSHK
jgi:hypothetical protein